MAAQSGFKCAQEVLDLYNTARVDGSLRYITMSLDMDAGEMVLSSQGAEGDVTTALTEISNSLPEKEPRNVLVRTDDKNEQGFIWLFFAYVPLNAPTKFKMLMASCRETVKRQLSIKEDIFCSEAEEVSAEAYEAHRTHTSAEAPLTEAERLQAEEHTLAVDTSSAQMAIAFPPTSECLTALHAFTSSKKALVTFKVDDEKLVLCSESETADVDALKSSLATVAGPCYALFQWAHEHAGSSVSTPVFFYYRPDDAAIKAKMLASSALGTVTGLVKHLMDNKAPAKVEVTDLEELTTEELMAEIHPVVAEEKKPAFTKPKGPSRRRGTRPTRKAKE